MNFRATVERRALLGALSIGAETAARVSRSIPILGCALLSTDDGALRIVTTDMDIEATTHVAAQDASGDPQAVPVDPLAAFVRALPEGCLVEMRAEGSRVVVRGAGATLRLSVLAADQFPRPEWEAGNAEPLKLRADSLHQTIGAVLPLCDPSNAVRSLYRGPLVQMFKSGLAAFSTNGGAIGKASAGDIDGEAMTEQTIPASVAKLALKLSRGIDEVDLTMGPRLFRLVAGNTVINAKVIDQPPLKYERVIPLNRGWRATLGSAGLLGALDRVAPSGDADASYGGNALRLAFLRGSLRISAASQKSEAEDEIACDAQTPMEVSVNARWLRAGMALLDADEIALELGEPRTSLVMRDAAAKDDRRLCCAGLMRF